MASVAVPLPSATEASQPRVLVHGSKARFAHCIVDELVSGGAPPALLSHWTFSPAVFVELRHDVSAFTVALSSGTGEGDGELPMSHAKFCPSHEIRAGALVGRTLPEPGQWVRTGVVMLVTADDGSVLLTKRAAHMRSFPSTWVLPGGHLDNGETLEEAGMRETLEETGVVVDPATVKPLCVWESNFPIDAPPKRQHVVIYFTGRPLPGGSREDWSGNTKPKVSLDPGEVAAAVWLTPAVLPAIVADLDPGSASDAHVPVLDVSKGEPGDYRVDTIREELTEGSRFAMAVYSSGFTP